MVAAIMVVTVDRGARSLLCDKKLKVVDEGQPWFGSWELGRRAEICRHFGTKGQLSELRGVFGTKATMDQAAVNRRLVDVEAAPCPTYGCRLPDSGRHIFIHIPLSYPPMLRYTRFPSPLSNCIFSCINPCIVPLSIVSSCPT